MGQDAHPEEHVQEQAQEDASRDRRTFLTRAAIGVAGAAGLVAIGAQPGQAAETSTKSKILERIRTQMAANPLLDGDGDDAYIKNSHSLYLKQDIE